MTKPVTDDCLSLSLLRIPGSHPASLKNLTFAILTFANLAKSGAVEHKLVCGLASIPFNDRHLLGPSNTAGWSKARGCSHNSFQKRACGHTSLLEWHTPGSRSRTYQGGALTKPGLVLFTSVGLRLSPSAALDDGMAGDSRPQRQRGLHPVASAAAVLPRRMFQPSRPCYR